MYLLVAGGEIKCSLNVFVLFGKKSLATLME
jgi:hypothetical protein